MIPRWRSALRVAWRPALLVGGMVAVGGLIHWSGVAGELSDMGRLGPVPFLLVGTVVCAAGLPRQGVAYAAGVAFGFWQGAAIALTAMVLACIVDFTWVRWLARDQVTRRLKGRLARMDQSLAQRPFAATLSLRLLPVGNNLMLTLLAAVSGVAAWPFFAASALGYMPQTAVFVLLGSGVRVGQGTQLAVGAAMFAASTALGWALLRRKGGAVPASAP